MVVVSQTLRRAVWLKRCDGIKQSQLAKQAGLHPSAFSQIGNDLVPIHPGDERVLKIAAVVGVSAVEAFTVVRERGQGR